MGRPGQLGATSVLVAGGHAWYRGKMASKKTRRKSRISKTEFVRTMPNASAQEIVAAAKKKGIKLSDRYVYVIRSKDKASKGKRSARKAAPRRAVARRAAARPTGLDGQLRQAIAQLGLVRAREIFSEVERAFSG